MSDTTSIWENGDHPPPDPAPQVKPDPYGVLRIRNFRLLFLGSLVASIGQRMLSIAIGWELYARTHSALVLGGVGLVMVLPVIFLSLPGGQIADTHNRQRIILITEGALALISLGLAVLSYNQAPIWMIYGCLLLMGCASAFNSPASSAFLSETIPEDSFERAATWFNSSWQLASVIGPALGGFSIALFQGTLPVYIFNTLAGIFMVLMVAQIRIQQTTFQEPAEKKQTTLKDLGEGLQFLRHSPIILAAITLDLFAVLFGGATTLLPIYAQDILKTGPTGLGWLDTAPSIGAICMTLLIAHRPPFRHAGRTLLLAVAGFGVATIVFGFSTSFWLSLLMLFVLGALDNISVIIRSTLMLTRTPNHMRGRVSAVNSLFIASSNQLGGFESGAVAQWLGPMLTVITGGIGTIVVVLAVTGIWPQIRQLTTLNTPDSEQRAEAKIEEVVDATI
ncbi:MFS transporter [Ktedonospora formicarum]|uniref:MFS transporter n=1 Tax=Ktedonospora formicarum TaxID=2778364 RepID=A0A8J3MQZ0_9CHLR|nr:MFS transporter [Ktedonospora formicarum]GHO43123.1 MFS transporter [Ktedonospora formicarum]